MTSRSHDHLISAAASIADDELFPAALEVDQSREIPAHQLQLLADAGLYGLSSPTDVGGAGADRDTIHSVLETLAGGCLTTAFIWSQHQGPCRASAATTGPMRELWAARLAAGTARGGVAFAHLLRRNDPKVTATKTDAGWRFDGVAPFVSGWGHIDVVLAAARHDDEVVWVMLDAQETETMTSRRLELAALDSTVTVELHFDGHDVATDRVTHIEPYDTWLDGYMHGLRANGSLSLGVTSRCLRLLGASPLDDELDIMRQRLDSAGVDDMAAARADASLLCVRAASALVADGGGRSVITDRHAQRLAREAMFLLVQGQTTDIKTVMVKRLTSAQT